MIVVDVGPGRGDRAALPTAGPRSALFHRWGRGGGGGGQEVGSQGFRFVFIPEITSPCKLCIPCKKNCVESSVADPDPGSGIGYLFDPWIRDPGWEKVSIRIRDEQPGSYFLELRNHFFFAFLGVNILKFFDEDPGSGMETVRIRDPGWKKVGSGVSGINIPDPQHW
jgi:hypothetical protein